MTHAQYGYRGVVTGWTPVCQASADWIAQMNVDALPGVCGYFPASMLLYAKGPAGSPVLPNALVGHSIPVFMCMHHGVHSCGHDMRRLSKAIKRGLWQLTLPFAPHEYDTGGFMMHVMRLACTLSMQQFRWHARAGGRHQPFYNVAVDMQDRPHQCTYVAQENILIVPPCCADFPGIDHPDVRYLL